MQPLSLIAVANLHLAFDWQFFLDFVFHPTGALIGALAITIYVSILAQLFGTGLGVLAALAGMSKTRGLRWINSGYVWFFRGTPLLVQLFLVYFGTPYLLGGIDLFPNHVLLGPLDLSGAVLAGLVALSVNEGAYMSEIVRAGILSVDPGQTEAARSLGMTSRLAMRRIVLPQAMRVIIPPLGNEFNNMLKTTSLMSVIGVSELFRVAEDVNSATFKSFEAYLGVAVYYLALTSIWSLIQRQIERRLGRGSATTSASGPSLTARLTGLRNPSSNQVGMR
jgi:polar amino acid transport system permease protein